MAKKKLWQSEIWSKQNIWQNENKGIEYNQEAGPTWLAGEAGMKAAVKVSAFIA